MKIHTERDLLRALPDRWRQAMKGMPDLYGVPLKSRSAVLTQLEALDLETVTPQEVAEIIGNASWSRLDRCGECGAWDCTTIIEVGEPSDIESATAYLCPSCFVEIAAKVSDFLSR